MDIKKNQYKSVQELEEVVTPATIAKDYQGLVDIRYYNGGLEPIVEKYVPEGLD